MPPRPFPSISPACQYRTRLALSTTFNLPLPTCMFANATTTQIRTKKSKAAISTSQIPVQLLKDVAGYGRAGALVPVPAGLMRAVFFPQRLAEYVPMTKHRAMLRAGTVIERDVLFEPESAKKKKGRSIANEAAPELASRTKLDMIAPAAAIEIMRSLVPPLVEFARVAVFDDENRSEARSDATHGEGSMEAGKAIYGSVSTTDILASVRALLAADTTASSSGVLGVLGTDTIRFLDAEGNVLENMDRVKTIGDFDFLLRVKGHDEVVKRTVRVIAETSA